MNALSVSTPPMARFPDRPGPAARPDGVNRFISSLQLSVTQCSRGTVLLFSRLGLCARKDGRTMGYLHVPALDARKKQPETTSPEAALIALQEILLERLDAGADLRDRFASLIAAAICVLAERHQWCFLTQHRPQKGGLAPWQEECAASYMKARISEPFSVGEVAQICGMSTPHFARSFKVSTGQPPYRWLQRRRMERAMELLARSSAAIADISLECGFSEQSHFTKSFRQAIGMTPGAWRQKHR